MAWVELGFMDPATQQILAEYIAELDRGRCPDSAAYAQRCPPPDGPDLFLHLLGELELLRDILPDPAGVPSRVGEYRILQELGRGGMGIVYAAEDPQGRSVALKILPQEDSSSADSAARFRREIKVLASFDHPHIARVRELGWQGQRPFVAMELLTGGTLADRIERRRKLGLPGDEREIRELCLIVAKVARAAAAAHAKGIIHRDIKPANILFDGQGDPRLVDFGLAYMSEASTLTTRDRVLGTLVYIAPERLLDPNAVTDVRVDIYSLGVTLYEAVAGVRPFQGALPELLAATRQGPPPLRLFLGRPGDRALEAILERCLSCRPGDRYAGADLLAEDLEAWCSGRPVWALRGAFRRRCARAGRRHALVFSACAALLVLLFCWEIRHHRQEALRRRQIDQFLVAAADPLAEFEEATGSILSRIDGTRRGASNSWVNLGRHEHSDLQPGEVTDELSMLEEKAEHSRLEAESNLLRAAYLGSKEARERLSALHRQQAVWLEHEGDFAAARAAWRLASGGGGPQAVLPHPAAIALGPPPVPATLSVKRYRCDLQENVIWPLETVLPEHAWNEAQVLGGFESGSYVLEFRRPDGHRIARYPLLLHRGETFFLRDLELPADGEIEPGWEYIPAGPFVAGDDVKAEASEPRVTRHVGGFFMKIHEVTMAEYFTFLADLSNRNLICLEPEYAHFLLDEKGWPAGLPAHIPRDDRDTPPTYTLANFARGRVPYLGTSMEMAVHRISHRDAEHYVRWLNECAEQQGEPWVYSLPSGDQWEKAARGADGRFFTWGNRFDWRLTAGGYTRFHVSLDPSEHMKPGRFPGDVSPFGIYDMVGNVREFCRDLDPVTGRYLVRGGEESFFQPNQFRLAARRGAALDVYNWDFGIRLVRWKKERSHSTDGH